LHGLFIIVILIDANLVCPYLTRAINEAQVSKCGFQISGNGKVMAIDVYGQGI
jgi:hypothetical protein